MNIPACFDNVIGIKNACDAQGNSLPAPSSGYYIQDLAGISLKTAAKVANSNYINGQDLLQHCIDVATSKLFDNLRISLAPYYRLDSIIESAQLGDFSANYLNYRNNDRGVRVFRSNSLNWVGRLGKISYDNLQSFRLNRLHFLCGDTVKDLVITVKDDQFNTYQYLIDTISEQVTTIETDLVLRGRTITITTNNQNVRVNEGDKYPNFTGLGCCGSGIDTFMGCNNRIQIQGWNKTEGKAYKSNFGVVPEMSLECGYESLLCAMKAQLGIILWYASGIEFINELCATDRINEYSSFFSRETAKESQSIWANGNKTRIAVLMDSMQKMFNSVRDSECVTCKQLGHTYSI